MLWYWVPSLLILSLLGSYLMLVLLIHLLTLQLREDLLVYPVVIRDMMFTAALVLLEIQGYDIILGIDWLTKHKETIDCEQKILTIVTPKEERLVHKRNNPRPVIPMILATRAYKLLKKGCPTYLCVVETVET